MAFLQEIKKIFTMPEEFFSKQAREKNLKQGVIAFMALSVVGLAIQLLFVSQFSAFPTSTMEMIIAAPAGIIVSLVSMAFCIGILHFLAKLCGGRGEYKALLACALYSQVAAGLVSIPFTILNMIFVAGARVGQVSMGASILIISIVFCFLIWMIYLGVVALKCCYQLSTGRALFVILLLVALFLLLAFLLIFVGLGMMVSR